MRADPFARAPRCWVAVQGPGNGLEDGGLSRTVRADDAGEPNVELDGRVEMLPEVAEMQPMQTHLRYRLGRCIGRSVFGLLEVGQPTLDQLLAVDVGVNETRREMIAQQLGQ